MEKSEEIGMEMMEEPGGEYGTYRSFKDLECWKICREVRNSFSQMVKSFPAEEKYELVRQIKRASRSTTANIAEGYGRYHYRENVQFCRTSRGSLHELIDHLCVALDEEYISQTDHDTQLELINKAIALLNGYINYLKKQIKD